MHRDRFYVSESLELHLFFLRIMKEHSLFLAAGFTPVDAGYAAEAKNLKQEFERLLCRVVAMSDSMVRRKILASEEIVTEFTAEAERQTVCFTGIPINGNVTQRELRLNPGDCRCADGETVRQVEEINRTALRLVCSLIDLKKRVLGRVMRCRMFTVNYPLLLEHIIREAELYRKYIENIEKGEGCDSMKEQELFWNRIMMEHALFMRGLFDPSENDLINTADAFAKDYVTLLARTREVTDRAMIHNEAFQKTREFKKFKTAGVQGIENCKIKSIILPLLADHVLREANHYLRILAG